VRRLALAALMLGGALSLTGCGPDEAAPAPAGPAVSDVEQHEATIDDLERVVGSAEAETANDG